MRLGVDPHPGAGGPGLGGLAGTRPPALSWSVISTWGTEECVSDEMWSPGGDLDVPAYFLSGGRPIFLWFPGIMVGSV